VNANELSPARRVVLLGLLSASAIAMHLAEAPLPRPLPWMKLGLANSTTLAALLLLGLPSALLVILVRQLAANLLLGTLGSPAFLLGLVGATVAGVAMASCLALAPKQMGLVSISALGALASNFGQLVTASILLGHGAIWVQLPLMMTVSIPSGLLVGFLTWSMLSRVPKELIPCD